MRSIYLDVCALCRPFDDQSYLRIALETEAVNMILSKVHRGNYQLIVSPVHIYELNGIGNSVEKIELITLLHSIGTLVKPELEKTRSRTEELNRLGFGIADAAHIAFAELANAEFISCDDRLLKKCNKKRITVWTGNPVLFCEKEQLR